MGKPTFDDRNSEVVTALGSSDFGFPVIKRRYETPEYIGGFKQTQGTETSQYLEERTSTETPLVVASERGPGQWQSRDNRKRLERRALVGDSPVRVLQEIVLE